MELITCVIIRRTKYAFFRKIEELKVYFYDSNQEIINNFTDT